MQLAIEIVAPSVKLLTPPEFFDVMVKIAEYAGRLSHRTEGQQTEDSAETFLRKWTIDGKTEQTRHESVLEHAAQLTFHFVMSRAASHQLVRHRLCAYTQESQRYCDYSKERFEHVLRVICPPSIAEVRPGTMVVAEATPRGGVSTWDDEVDYTYSLIAPDAMGTADVLMKVEPFRRWAFAIIRAYGRYIWLRKAHNVPAEDARFLLPNATKTEIIMTTNARQWRHVFRMRRDKHAQWEIRGLMQSAWTLLALHMPIVFNDAEMNELGAGA